MAKFINVIVIVIIRLALNFMEIAFMTSHSTRETNVELLFSVYLTNPIASGQTYRKV